MKPNQDISSHQKVSHMKFLIYLQFSLGHEDVVLSPKPEHSFQIMRNKYYKQYPSIHIFKLHYQVTKINAMETYHLL